MIRILSVVHQACYECASNRDKSIENNEFDVREDAIEQRIQAAANGGHVGRDKTLPKLLDSNFWWPRIKSDVRNFVKICPGCQIANTTLDKAAPTMHTIPIPNKVCLQTYVHCHEQKKDLSAYVLWWTIFQNGWKPSHIQPKPLRKWQFSL
jgi:hypothetical protein